MGSSKWARFHTASVESGHRSSHLMVRVFSRPHHIGAMRPARFPFSPPGGSLGDRPKMELKAESEREI